MPVDLLHTLELSFHSICEVQIVFDPNSTTHSIGWRTRTIAALTGIGVLLAATPASAHHAMGSKLPANFFEGFLSGVAHPIIGIDHLAFVIASGLLAALLGQKGLWVPIAFAIAAMGGTQIHIMQWNLPAAETCIALSVLTFGLLLALKERPHPLLTIALAAIAGIFHGYAYGESIVGAQMTPLLAYLAGFTLIQLSIALLARYIGGTTLQAVSERPTLALRFAGFTICGIGAAFLATSIQ